MVATTEGSLLFWMEDFISIQTGGANARHFTVIVIAEIDFTKDRGRIRSEKTTSKRYTIALTDDVQEAIQKCKRVENHQQGKFTPTWLRTHVFKISSDNKQPNVTLRDKLKLPERACIHLAMLGYCNNNSVRGCSSKHPESEAEKAAYKLDPALHKTWCAKYLNSK